MQIRSTHDSNVHIKPGRVIGREDDRDDYPPSIFDEWVSERKTSLQYFTLKKNFFLSIFKGGVEE